MLSAVGAREMVFPRMVAPSHTGLGYTEAAPNPVPLVEQRSVAIDYDPRSNA